MRSTVAAVLLLTLAGCSMMDEVDVVHGCLLPLEVTVTHLRAIEPDGGEQEYQEDRYTEQAEPGIVTAVAGMVNMYRHDLVGIEVAGSYWEVILTRSELRALDGPFEIPAAACPASP